MSKIDLKHIAFHVLVALYFIWFIVFIILNIITLIGSYKNISIDLNNAMFNLITLNLIMGTALYIVISMFRKHTRLTKTIKYSYLFVVLASVLGILITKIL
ncbi:hypothetical protein GCM10007424_13250 [Flavobacterium suaedae]|uniref:Uncharacterized protein n=1 Tax=Flavobacterium suaedae TaxID=1767027 RepID=A0ABQ1JSQ1_9FLAO|nr:hypothetical protein [Flavobacterium suaedae]GGB74666.1 hypothetical protein GCM10007424_13250 [Flavobacterium suaedae]